MFISVMHIPANLVPVYIPTGGNFGIAPSVTLGSVFEEVKSRLTSKCRGEFCE